MRRAGGQSLLPSVRSAPPGSSNRRFDVTSCALKEYTARAGRERQTSSYYNEILIVLFGALLPHRTYKPWGGGSREVDVVRTLSSTTLRISPGLSSSLSLYPCVCVLSGAPFLCGEERRAYRREWKRRQAVCDGSGKCALAVRTPLSGSSARSPKSSCTERSGWMSSE
jgi:hypothetical protein